ncbi:Rv3654c family TadE-like protein [Aeromicrobium sp. Leaf350]|uniref:Rv3654c family TadE-like protein n=1 Tax=Aeromicrobium sp. Leaf350 TaxID=2876565 RepID=UPI001E65C6EC|nr:Rv3654c family TadE-like protein [Aeromicrobium sp. Leaf350]
MTRCDDRGAVSSVALGVSVLLLVVAGGALELGVAVGVKHTAASAADLAALAGSRAVEASADGCAAAGLVARRNGAELVECRLDAAVATVTTEVRTPRWWGRTWTSRQVARAAPATYLEEP